ncbi:MAG: hypothetical protein ACQSGP_25055 [Frankia sp.]
MKWIGRRHGKTGAVASGGSAGSPGGWWWCFDHQRAENPPDSPGNRRLGPYESSGDAENWQARLDARNDAWDAEDARWSGPRT